MKRSTLSDESDDDVWNYKPVKKKKVETHRRGTAVSVKSVTSKVTKSKTCEHKTSSAGKKTNNVSLIKNSKKTVESKRKEANNIELIQIYDHTSADKTIQNDDHCIGLESTNEKDTTEPHANSVRKQLGDGHCVGLAKTPNSKVNTPRTPAKTPITKCKHDGNCPHCQLPFEALTIESPRWHTMECMDLPIIATQECSQGINCDNTIPSHYRKFRHTLLAELRAGCSQIDKEITSIITPGKSSRKLDFDARINESPIRNMERNEQPDELQPPTMNSSDDVALLTSEKTIIKEEYDADVVSTELKTIALIEITPTKSELKKMDGSITSPYFENKALDTTDINDTKGSVCVCISEQTTTSINGDVFDVSQGVTTETTDNPPGSSFDVRDEDALTNDELNHIFSPENDIDISIDQDSCLMSPSKDEKSSTSDMGIHELHVTRSKSNNPSVEGTPRKTRQYVGNVSKQSPRLKGNDPRQLSIASFFRSTSNTDTGAVDRPVSSTSKPGTRVDIPSLTRSRTSKAGLPAVGPSGISSSTENAGGSNYGSKRKCPFYKKIPDTAFTVDAFRFGNIIGCHAYFLTHFHYDHYGGLAKKFTNKLYCSPITANLVKKKIRVGEKYITTIPLDVPTMIMGTEVTFMDANHCPGAVIILFKLPNGKVILHTGDFRADLAMQTKSPLIGIKVDELYLDTTYCDPQYAFPPQQDVINFAVNLATDFIHENPNTLIVVGSYTIGKERIFLAIAEALHCKIFVTREKKNILDCLEDTEVNKKLTLSPLQAKVHVLPMKELNYNGLSAYIQKFKGHFDKILGFEPTGWTHNKKKSASLGDTKPKIKSKDIVLYGVPYSEHSSYTELREFVQFIRPNKILPTVNNGNPASRKKMESLFKSWLENLPETTSPNKLFRQSAISSWFSW